MPVPEPPAPGSTPAVPPAGTAAAPPAAKQPGTWRHMVESNQAMLLRKTGKDTAWWVEQARQAGIRNDRELRDWMRDGYGVTGYAQYAVSWELFGYPDFMLRDADELLDGQYARHPDLRPIAEAILAWAAATDGVHIQMRKGFVSLHSPRRKFAQVTRSTNSAVDLTLRYNPPKDDDGGAHGPGHPRLEQVRTRPDDPFTCRVRLAGPGQVDDKLLGLLAEALAQNS